MGIQACRMSGAAMVVDIGLFLVRVVAAGCAVAPFLGEADAWSP